MTEETISSRLARLNINKQNKSVTFRLVLTPELIDLGIDENTEFVRVTLVESDGHRYIKIEKVM